MPTTPPDRLTIPRPDDWHVHLRDDELLAETVPATARVFARAIVMPNLVPPITTVAAAEAYRDRILAAVPEGVRFEPQMTLYLTEATPAAEIEQAAAAGITACKLYPAGATTNSANGVGDPARIYHLFESMAAVDLPLLIHGEVTDPTVDIFDREAVFIQRHLAPIRAAFPSLRIVLEHITTADAAEWVCTHAQHTAATITPQHLWLNRNDLLVGGVRPHNYCLPILKRRRHQEALVQAAISGDPRFFLGTDSAPHARTRKESACGCAGCYSAPAALPLYATLFERHDALDRLADFASGFGADFYRRPRATETVTLERQEWIIPETVQAGSTVIIPWMAGESLPWRMAEAT